MPIQNKICLIRPPAVETLRFASTSITPPLGLAYIAGSIRKLGWNVQVLDAVASSPENLRRYFKGYLIGLSFDEIVERIDEDVDAIGVSVIFTHEWPLVVELVKRIRARFRTTPVILGGEHITSMPAFSALTSEADFFVMGEGEETIVELLKCLEDGHSKDEQTLFGISGIVYKKADGSIAINPRRQRNLDVDKISPPAWDLFDLRSYHNQGFVGGMYSNRLTVPILATRGCPYQCTYCSSPNMWSPLWIPRDPIKVVDEIQFYVDKFGAGNFPFQDLTAIIKKDWILRFCQEIVKRNLDISWQLPSGTRSEVIDDEVAEWLAKSGMKAMAYAPESGSEETRKLIHKKLNATRMLASVKSAASASLNVSAFFVIGFPHDRYQNFIESLDFISALARLGVKDIAIGYYMALPGTQLFHHLYERAQLKIEVEYFSHILDAQSFFPHKTFSPHVSRYGLMFWKFFMFAWFYGHRLFYSMREIPFVRVPSVVFSAFNISRRQNHATKLQTVVQNFWNHIVNMQRVRKQPRWISRTQEKTFFKNWNGIYQFCISEQLRQGSAVQNTDLNPEELKNNYYFDLKKTHQKHWAVKLVDTFL